jgi:hypothetical protein
MTEAGEILKSGAFDKLADIIHKLAGPMADEIGLMMADKIKVYRVKNWVNVVKKTQKILSEAHLDAESVPPRLFLPILEASSIEADDTLQSLWAGLLASASKESDSLSPSFIETLKQLTPAEAKALNEFFESVPTQDFQRFRDAATSLVLRAMKEDVQLLLICETFQRLGFFSRLYDVRQVRPQRYEMESNEIVWQYEFTKYGIQFMKACRGPGEAGHLAVREAD